MILIRLIITYVISFNLISATAAATPETTPSERFLQGQSWESITTQLDDRLHSCFLNSIPLLQQTVAAEVEPGFFGYHASSQKLRLFQDILRVVFEEVVLIPIPEDFQFFRIPGDDFFTFREGKEEFFRRYKRSDTDKVRSVVANALLFLPLEKELGVCLRYEEFSPEQQSQIWNTFQELLYFIDEDLIYPYFQNLGEEDVSMEELKGRDAIPKGALPFSAFKEKLQKLVHYYKKSMEKNFADTSDAFFLQKGLSLNYYSAEKQVERLFPLLLQKISEEKNVDAAILYSWLEGAMEGDELLYQSLDTDENKPDGMLVWQFLFPIWDVRKDQQSLLVSINVPLFGNMNFEGESTLAVFLEGESISNGDNGMTKRLKAFFLEIGLEPELAKKLWQLGTQKLAAEGSKGGILLQLFDREAKRFNPGTIMNRDLYVSVAFGVPVIRYAPYEMIEQEFAQIFNGYLDPQLRLLMENETTLNPMGGLRVVRYDLYGEELARQLLSLLRQEVRQAPQDQNKTEIYREKISSLW